MTKKQAKIPVPKSVKIHVAETSSDPVQTLHSVQMTTKIQFFLWPIKYVYSSWANGNSLKFAVIFGFHK